MSFMRSQILINKDNSDIFDTLNEPFVNALPKGMVADTQANRLNAALACVYQLAKQVRNLQIKVYELENA